MTCDNAGLVGLIANISTPQLVAGADCFITTEVVYAGSSPPDPYKFQSFLGATAYFPSATPGTAVSIPGTLVSADLGQVKFAIPAASSILLAIGEEQSFEQRFQDALGLTIIQFNQSLTVVAKLF